MKYRKKPVVIEAVEWTGGNSLEVFEFLGGFEGQEATGVGECFYFDNDKVEGGLVIKTLEGEHKASVGDMIIKGIAGEFYPCKPEIFAATYELTEKQA